MKKYILILFILFSLNLNAQPIVDNTEQNSAVEMADAMRSDGKIYIVVAVVASIMAGIVIYLVRLDRKITRLENEINAKDY
jgi:tRNA(Phe) wybutosine-synthesizing methylase Tyw3